MWAEFKAFLLRSNALALAIGVVIGAALGGVVTSLVNDVIMPPVGLLLGKVDFTQLRIVLQAATDPADPTTEVAIRYGTFLNAVIAFLVISFVVWRISKAFIRETPAAPAAPTKPCPYCLESNAVAATKCRACASGI